MVSRAPGLTQRLSSVNEVLLCVWTGYLDFAGEMAIAWEDRNWGNTGDGRGARRPPDQGGKMENENRDKKPKVGEVRRPLQWLAARAGPGAHLSLLSLVTLFRSLCLPAIHRCSEFFQLGGFALAGSLLGSSAETCWCPLSLNWIFAQMSGTFSETHTDHQRKMTSPRSPAPVLKGCKKIALLSSQSK